MDRKLPHSRDLRSYESSEVAGVTEVQAGMYAE